MKNLYVVTLSISIILNGCHQVAPDYELTPDKLIAYKNKAEKGDVESAKKVALHYDHFNDANRNNFRTWSLKAAELGDRTFLYIVYQDDFREYNEDKKKGNIDCTLLLRGLRFANKSYIVTPDDITKDNLKLMNTEAVSSGCQPK